MDLQIAGSEIPLQFSVTPARGHGQNDKIDLYATKNTCNEKEFIKRKKNSTK